MTEFEANQWLLEALEPKVPSQYDWHTPNANDLKVEQNADTEHNP